MTRGTAIAKGAALTLAVVAHAAFLLIVPASEEVQIEGADGAAEVRLGNAFADMTAGTLSGARPAEPSRAAAAAPDVARHRCGIGRPRQDHGTPCAARYRARGGVAGAGTARPDPRRNPPSCTARDLYHRADNRAAERVHRCALPSSEGAQRRPGGSAPIAPRGDTDPKGKTGRDTGPKGKTAETNCAHARKRNAQRARR